MKKASKQSSDRRHVPDFLARVRAIYGHKILKASGAKVIAKDRDRY